jgi:hypothetical protein
MEPHALVFRILLGSNTPTHGTPEHAPAQGARRAHAPGTAELAAAFVALPEPTLTRLLDDLEPHKVYPLLAHRLSEHGQLALLPPEVRARLLTVQREVLKLNGLLFLAAARLLQTAQALGTEPLVLKGLLFADSYYPELATRPMGDIDLVAAPGQAELLHLALARVGFERVLDHVEQDHAVAFANAQGVSCDAHAYLEMYPDAAWEGITRPTSLRRVRGVTVRALEPNVMVGHLMLHMHGHLRELGLVLSWLLDLVFVLRRHGSELDPGALRGWIEDDEAWAFFLRVLGLLERHGETLPVNLISLGADAQRLPSPTLASVFRARRTTPWGLPGVYGYLRLLAHHLALRDYGSRQTPAVTDLCWLPFDQISTHLSTRVARNWGRSIASERTT